MRVAEEILTDQVKEDINALGEIEIVVGIPSYNNVHTIGHVLQTAQKGLPKYFPGRKALIFLREFPRLCRGGSKSLTFAGVHRGNSST